MAVSERAIGNALGWPTPLACLYSIAMETGIGVRDYPNDDGDTAAIVADGKIIALNSCLEDDGHFQGHGEHVGAEPIVLQARVEGDDLAIGDDGGGIAVVVRVVADPDPGLHGDAVKAGEGGGPAQGIADRAFRYGHMTSFPSAS